MFRITVSAVIGIAVGMKIVVVGCEPTSSRRSSASAGLAVPSHSSRTIREPASPARRGSRSRTIRLRTLSQSGRSRSSRMVDVDRNLLMPTSASGAAFPMRSVSPFHAVLKRSIASVQCPTPCWRVGPANPARSTCVGPGSIEIRSGFMPEGYQFT